jgi:hypothetical protein
MGTDEEVKKKVKDWFRGMMAEFYDADMQRLVT